MSCYEVFLTQGVSYLTLSYRRYLLYRTRSIDLLCKSMDWFLYVRDLPHERVKGSKARPIWNTWFFRFSLFDNDSIISRIDLLHLQTVWKMTLYSYNFSSLIWSYSGVVSEVFKTACLGCLFITNDVMVWLTLLISFCFCFLEFEFFANSEFFNFFAVLPCWHHISQLKYHKIWSTIINILLWWCRALDLLGSQIPVTIGGFELQQITLYARNSHFKPSCGHWNL